MNFIFDRFRSKLQALISPQLRNFRYLMGQSAILSSRAHSEKFINLWDAEVKVYSQWGEDGILDYLCERIGISKPKVLEIGAGNFTECNSRFLAENRNASVFAVDGRDDLIPSVERNPMRWRNHIFAYQTWVTPNNINEIIMKSRESIGTLDVFSIDLDGNDYWILEAAGLESVSIVVVEYNPLFGHKRAVSVPRDDTFNRSSKHYSCLYYGASLKAFKILLEKKDFVFVGTNRVGNNAFFVSRSSANLIPLKISEDYSIYTDWRVRETRTINGNLSFASGYDRVAEISEQTLIDIETGKEISVGESNPSQF